MSNSFVQVPPDGTGKKIYHTQHTVGSDIVQVAGTILADATNPSRGLKINEHGAASVRFTEGEPTFDTIGALRVAQAFAIATYDHVNQDLNDTFQTIVGTGGTYARNVNRSSMVLTTSTVATASVSRTSHRYHYYQPGVGNLIIQTLNLSDAGKANNTRRWGYYDTTNGLYWELNNTTLSVNIRSYTTGAVTVNSIPRASWNGDLVDGFGISGVTLDLTKGNFFWIDYAWLGVAPVRFGIEDPNGERIVCHTFQTPNSTFGPYMSTGTLPLQYENINTGVTAGTTDLSIICAAVYAQTLVNYTFWRYADMSVTNKSVTIDTPVIAVRSKTTFNGKTNRVNAYPQTLSVYVTGGDIKLDLVQNATSITGGTWTLPGESTVEGDVGGSAVVLGSLGWASSTHYLGVGSHNIDVGDLYEVNDDGILLWPDATTQPVWAIVATRLTGTATTVSATLSYRELR